MQVTKVGLERVESDAFKKSVCKLFLKCFREDRDRSHDILATYTALVLCEDRRAAEIFKFTPSPAEEAALQALMDSNAELIKQIVNPIVDEFLREYGQMTRARN